MAEMEAKLVFVHPQQYFQAIKGGSIFFKLNSKRPSHEKDEKVLDEDS